MDGVDVGEDWAVIADRSGLYLFDGGEPVKISQEIQPLWDSINWAAGYTLWVRVDTRAKRILVGVPISPATQPNRVLALDYRGLQTAGEIMSLSTIHSSQLHRAQSWRRRVAANGRPGTSPQMRRRLPNDPMARRSFSSATARATGKSTN